MYHIDAPSSNDFVQLKPSALFALKEAMETKGKYSPVSQRLMTVPCVIAYKYLQKAINIVENTEEYAEYLLFRSFDQTGSYKKIPPGTIRIYGKDLVCFYNGRTWRKLK